MIDERYESQKPKFPHNRKGTIVYIKEKIENSEYVEDIIKMIKEEKNQRKNDKNALNALKETWKKMNQLASIENM